MSATARFEAVAARESAATVPVYAQLPFLPERAEGCHIITADRRRILDLYGGHAVAGLGYAHPALTRAIREQAGRLLFQSNAAVLEQRAQAAERLASIAPAGLDRTFFVNSGAEANENALRIACSLTGRGKVLAITHGFHGRTAAAAAVTWGARENWYGFPHTPFEVDFIPRDDVAAAARMIDRDIAAVIFEPIQGIAGACALSGDFVTTLRRSTREAGAMLIADEVQSGMGRSGHWFAVQRAGVVPDLMTVAKSLGGGVPCGALLATSAIAASIGAGQLGSTFGGGPLACAAIVATIRAIEEEGLLQNAQDREAEIRSTCITGPVMRIQGAGLLLGLVCDRPAVEVRNALLERGILTGTSADPGVLRLLPPLILRAADVSELASALTDIGASPTPDGTKA